MPALPPSTVALVRAQRGLITIDQLAAHGVSRHARGDLVSAGVLVPGSHGVYRSAAHDVTFLQRCLAACLAAPDVVVSGPSGGRLYAARKMPSGPVHVLARRRVVLDDVTAHRTNSLWPSDVLHRGDGIRVLRPSRLVPDLAHFLDDHALESVIEQFLDRGLVNMPTLFGMARRLRASGRDGSLRLARVLESRPAWLRPKDSDLEVKVLRALAAREIVLETQIEFDLGGVTIHVDAGDRRRRFGLEIDHVSWHGGRLDSQHDKWRDRQLTRRGWLVCRVTDEDLVERFNATIDDVAAIYHLRPAA